MRIINFLSKIVNDLLDYRNQIIFVELKKGNFVSKILALHYGNFDCR